MFSSSSEGGGGNGKVGGMRGGKDMMRDFYDAMSGGSRKRRSKRKQKRSRIGMSKRPGKVFGKNKRRKRGRRRMRRRKRLGVFS